MKKNKRHIKLKIAIAMVLVLMWIIVGLFRYANSPRLQAIAINSINKISSFQIESAKLHLDILARHVELTNISIYNKKKGHRFRIEKVSFKFGILPLLKGSLWLDDLIVNDVRIDIEKTETKKEKRKEISLKSLLVLKNIRVKDAHLNSLKITLPAGTIESTEITADYIPSIFGGDIDVDVNVNGTTVTKYNIQPMTVENINIKGKTDIYKWLDLFPYINDLSGQISYKILKWKDLTVERSVTDLDYSDNDLQVKLSRGYIEGHPVEIKGAINFNTEKYSLALNIPEPIYLPPLGGKYAFLDTSGKLSGNVTVTGTGLDFKTTRASAVIHADHTLGVAEPLPVMLDTKAVIEGGVARTADTLLKVGDTPVSVECSLNFVHPNIDLKFSGENIPVETVMNRFQLKYYHPTRGVASAEGTLTGWKSDLKFSLAVHGRDMKYYEITAEKVEMTLDVTYHDLKLIGSIYQDDNEMGAITINMKMGKMLPEGTRAKTIDLQATVKDADLSRTMEYYGMTGRANGTLNLKGVNSRYDGLSKVTINDGSIKEIGFQYAEGDIKFETRKLTLSNIFVKDTKSKEFRYTSPIVMIIDDSGLRITGKPREGIDIDARYSSGNASWRIDKLTYVSLENTDWKTTLTGTIGGKGELNLKLNGLFDTSLLTSVKGLLRDTDGPLELKNLRIGGNTKDITIDGSVIFHNNAFQARTSKYYFDGLTGELVFNGRKITMKDLKGRVEYGDFELIGTADIKNNQLDGANIDFKGRSVSYATPDRSFRMEFDCELKLAGNRSSSLLSGKVNILDARYTKKFSLFESMKQTGAYSYVAPVESEWKNLRLDLAVRTNGDFEIDNNLGKILLGVDLNIRGTEEKPQIAGNVETLGGQIHYAGIDFEITKGYIEFRAPYTNPYIEFNASKEVGDYNVSVLVKGQTDKLYFELYSTPPLERNDILALLTFGVTDESAKKTKFGYQFGTGLATEQVGAVIEKPVKKYTPLDRFRIDISPSGNSSNDVTRLSMGKDISDRLKLNFITDINTQNAQQTFQAEYLLTDFMLLKGEKMSNNQYTFHLTLRFSEQ